MQSIEQFIKVKTYHLRHIYSEGYYVSSIVLLWQIQVQVDFVRSKRFGQSLVLGGYM